MEFHKTKSTPVSTSAMLPLNGLAQPTPLYFSLISTFIRIIHSLFHFLGGEVQITVVDPLHLKPVLEVAVTTTLELHLQTVNGLLLEASTWGVCVLQFHTHAQSFNNFRQVII